MLGANARAKRNHLSVGKTALGSCNALVRRSCSARRCQGIASFRDYWTARRVQYKGLRLPCATVSTSMWSANT
jgi:hypothetical protein